MQPGLGSSRVSAGSLQNEVQRLLVVISVLKGRITREQAPQAELLKFLESLFWSFPVSGGLVPDFHSLGQCL